MMVSTAESVKSTIELWSYGEDGREMSNWIRGQLSLYYDDEAVKQHCFSELPQKNEDYVYGTIIVILSHELIQFVSECDYIMESFEQIKSSVNKRFYVMHCDQPAQALLLLRGTGDWNQINLKSRSWQQQVTNATLNRDNITREEPTRRRNGRGKGTFSVHPNHFSLADKQKQGVIVITEEDRSQLGFTIKSIELRGFLLYQSKSGIQKYENRKELELKMEVPQSVYSFILPENLSSGKYMLHLEGVGGIKRTLGSRSLTLTSAHTLVCENIFTERLACELSQVSDLDTRDNIDVADSVLASMVQELRLPMQLPRKSSSLSSERRSHLIFPTLLHLACYYGMENLVGSIIDLARHRLPDIANQLNSDKKTAMDMAKPEHANLLELLNNQLKIEEQYTDLYVRNYNSVYESSHYVVNPKLLSGGSMSSTNGVDAEYEDVDEVTLPRSVSVKLSPVCPPPVEERNCLTLPSNLNHSQLMKQRCDPEEVNSEDIRCLYRQMRGKTVNRRLEIQSFLETKYNKPEPTPRRSNNTLPPAPDVESTFEQENNSRPSSIDSTQSSFSSQEDSQGNENDNNTPDYMNDLVDGLIASPPPINPRPSKPTTPALPLRPAHPLPPAHHASHTPFKCELQDKLRRRRDKDGTD